MNARPPGYQPGAPAGLSYGPSVIPRIRMYNINLTFNVSSNTSHKASINETQITTYIIQDCMAAYEETEFLISKIAFQMLLLILIASDIFILICTQMNIGTEMWMFYIATIVFAAVILLFYLLRLHIIIDDSTITIKYVKKRVVKFTEVIDHKTGDIDVIRNYSGWGSKNVKYKNYICHGYERGISFKLMGRNVITLSSADPETIAALVPRNIVLKEKQDT